MVRFVGNLSVIISLIYTFSRLFVGNNFIHIILLVGNLLVIVHSFTLLVGNL